jgi:hypothetical protein
LKEGFKRIWGNKQGSFKVEGIIMESLMSLLQPLLSLKEGLFLAKFCIPLIFYLDPLKVLLEVQARACPLPKDGILLLQ